MNVLRRNGYNDRLNKPSLLTGTANTVRITDAILSYLRICYKSETHNRAASAKASAALEYACEYRVYFTVAYMKYLYPSGDDQKFSTVSLIKNKST